MHKLTCQAGYMFQRFMASIALDESRGVRRAGIHTPPPTPTKKGRIPRNRLPGNAARSVWFSLLPAGRADLVRLVRVHVLGKEPGPLLPEGGVPRLVTKTFLT